MAVSNAQQVRQTPGLPPGWSPGWAESPVTHADVVAGGSAIIRFIDGSRETFRWSGQAWVPDEPAVQHSSFSSVPGGFRWTSETGVKVELNAAGEALSATSAVDDRQPAGLVNVWANNRLDRINDAASSRKIELTYTGDSGSTCATSPPAGLALAPTGMLCRVDHMDGSAVQLFYTSGGQIARIVEDGNGDLSSGVDDQAVTDLQWNADGLLVSVRSPFTNRLIAAGKFPVGEAGHTTDVTYDTARRVTSVTGELANATQPRPKMNFAYDVGGPRINTVTDANRSEPNGYTMRYRLDESGRAFQVEDRLGRSTFTKWRDLSTHQVLWTDSESRDTANQPVFLRTSTIFDDRDRVTATWGPAPRAEFGATTWDGGGQVGGPATPTSTTVIDGGLGGLAAAFWPNDSLSGAPAGHGYQPTGAFSTTGAPDASVGADGWSARLSGSTRFPVAGTYTLSVNSHGPVRAFIGAPGPSGPTTLFTDGWVTDPGGTAVITRSVSVTVNAAQTATWYPIRVEFADTAGTGGLSMNWTGPAPYTTNPVIDAQFLRPEFGLTTRTERRVDATTTRVNAVSYDDPATPGVNESFLGIPPGAHRGPRRVELPDHRDVRNPRGNQVLPPPVPPAPLRRRLARHLQPLRRR